MAKRSRSTSIQDNLLVATESTRGLKATNEDRACSVRVERVGMCFGVYDGHGGTEAADFTTANLIRNIAPAGEGAPRLNGRTPPRSGRREQRKRPRCRRLGRADGKQQAPAAR